MELDLAGRCFFVADILAIHFDKLSAVLFLGGALKSENCCSSLLGCRWIENIFTEDGFWHMKFAELWRYSGVDRRQIVSV